MLCADLRRPEDPETIIINRSDRSTYPREKSVQTSGATPAITVSPYAGEACAIEVRQEIERLDPALAKLVELSVLSERRYKANF
jgi:hypothetical protein